MSSPLSSRWRIAKWRPCFLITSGGIAAKATNHPYEVDRAIRDSAVGLSLTAWRFKKPMSSPDSARSVIFRGFEISKNRIATHTFQPIKGIGRKFTNSTFLRPSTFHFKETVSASRTCSERSANPRNAAWAKFFFRHDGRQTLSPRRVQEGPLQVRGVLGTLVFGALVVRRSKNN